MKILVIDDMQEQRDHAISTLSDHEVVTANDWNSGKEAIEKGGWDMVLTDLSMPALSDGQGEGKRYVGDPTPYGFPLALIALRAGVPKVAIVSNGNHHSHPIFWAADSLHGTIIPGQLWAFTGYDCPLMTEESLPGVNKPWQIKDWSAVVEKLSK